MEPQRPGCDGRAARGLPEPPVAPVIPPPDHHRSRPPRPSASANTTLLPGQGARFVVQRPGGARRQVRSSSRASRCASAGGSAACRARAPFLRRLRRSVDSPAAYRRLLRKAALQGLQADRPHPPGGRPRPEHDRFQRPHRGPQALTRPLRALLKLTDLAGNVSRTEVVRFRVLQRRRWQGVRRARRRHAAVRHRAHRRAPSGRGSRRPRRPRAGGVIFCGGEEKLPPGPLPRSTTAGRSRRLSPPCGGSPLTPTPCSTSRTSPCCRRRPSCGWRHSRSRSGCATRRPARCSSRRATSRWRLRGPEARRDRHR